MTSGAGIVREIDPDRVRHVALLARLALDEDEVALYARRLTGILHHLNKLAEMDLEGVEPTSHAIPLGNVFREDSPRPGLSRDDALRNAPDQQDGCFKVPQII